MEYECGIRFQEKLIEALATQLKEAGRLRLCETHLSWILVTERVAYKIKKALRFDFVDYSTLALRRHYCEEELRLNRRLAPSIYLDVLPIAGTVRQPRPGGPGEAIEYALKMRALDPDAFWDRRLSHSLLQASEIDQLARMLADFHEQAARAPRDADWGSSDTIRSIALSNLADLKRFTAHRPEAQMVDDLEARLAIHAPDLAALFMQRKAGGFVRECHGDLHLGNILTEDGEVQIFDCIEFNERLRWIDVMDDIAFVCMELEFHACRHYAARLLSRYLEQTADYGGLRLFSYYKINRALVRSKVAYLKAAQSAPNAGEDAAVQARAAAYLAYAHACLAERKPCLMITHGFSGAGKSTLARAIVELTGAIQLRSDVERKRLPGATKETAQPGINAGLYRPEISRQVYARLAELAEQVLGAGFSVIVDAAFLKHEQRRRFQSLAEKLAVPLYVFDIRADVAAMRRGIAARRVEGRDASDATLAVLDDQLRNHDPFSPEEARHLVQIDRDDVHDATRLAQLCLAAMRTP